MLYRDICKILGLYLFGFVATLFIPLFVDLYYRFIIPEGHPQPFSTLPFIETIAICLGLALVFYWIGRHSTGHLYRREGLVAVALIWFISPAIAALPFYLSKTLRNPFQAYFESASGLTTTGLSVMTAKKFNEKGEEIPIVVEVPGVISTKYVFYGTIDPVTNPKTGKVYDGVEAVGKGLLFWRSFIQWLGGVGIVVLFVAILPLLGVGGKVLFQMEMPGPIKDSLTPRIKETASVLWKIYVGLTIAQTALLMLTNKEIDLFNSLCIAFTTISTGGLSVLNASIGGYHNAWTDWIILVFMVLGSINFTIYFYALKGKFYRAYEPEFFTYLVILTITCWMAAWYLVGTPKLLLGGSSEGVYSWSEAIRYGFFQIVSAHTSTGFVIADYDYWPYVVQALLVIVTFVGGMAGSTAGGTKVVRLYMLFRIIQNKVESLFRPETVRQFRFGDKEVDANASLMILCFLGIMVAFSVFSTLFFIMDGIDLETSFGLVTSMINNCGLAYRVAGPTGSCAFLSNLSCVVGSIIMILGRLEFFAVLAILVPAFWKQV